MASLSILDGKAARPQTVSPLFTLLPMELRLVIYQFVFAGSRALVWLDRLMNIGEYIGAGRARPNKRKSVNPGKCCYEHLGGSFGLLATCHAVYIEAYPTYWSETTLEVMRLGSPDLVKICARLPAMVKANLRHLRGVNFPVQWCIGLSCEFADWAPILLGEFPKLVSCEARTIRDYDGHKSAATSDDDTYYIEGHWKEPCLLTVPDSGELSQSFHGVGPFRMETGENPVAYLERTIGFQRSCGVIILSKWTDDMPRCTFIDFKRRYQYFNWTTGMVYQTTTPATSPQGHEDAYQEVMGAEDSEDSEGSEGLPVIESLRLDEDDV